MDAVVYIHGQGGDAAECGHYRALFPDYEVVGLDYHAQTPWEAVCDFAKAHNATLTVMDGGGHWFHTDAQMRFLDNWICAKRIRQLADF